jgi:DNA invertase Pin-like site-specific DNA recombinase
VDDLSRLTRDSVEQEVALRRLEFAGVRVIGVSDAYDSALLASRKVTRAIRGLQNEMFLDDLSQKVHRGQTGVALAGKWVGGKVYGYRLRPVFDSTRKDPYGNPARIATELEVDQVQAKVVLAVFTRYADGASCFTVAKELNESGTPSPGTTWRRKVRRKSGWMTSSIRVIFKNPLYTGAQRWNVSKFVRNPDTGSYLRRARPRSEWVVNQIEALRIVSDDLFRRVRERERKLVNGDARLKAGGKPKHVLSGLLVCSVCGAHYILGDAFKYGCSSFLNGRACNNRERVRRDHLEDVILGPIRNDLLAPGRVARMTKELQKQYTQRARALDALASELPMEVQRIDARLTRLRERLVLGDPDMTVGELQGVIDRIEAERARLVEHPGRAWRVL